MSRSSDRLPSPGPSYARADPVRLRGSTAETDGPLVRLGMAKPTGIDVPGELMVAGPSDFGLAEKSTPPMTSLEYDAEQHGREAAEMLIRLVRDEPIDEPRKVMRVALVERDSTRR